MISSFFFSPSYFIQRHKYLSWRLKLFLEQEQLEESKDQIIDEDEEKMVILEEKGEEIKFDPAEAYVSKMTREELEKHAMKTISNENMKEMRKDLVEKARALGSFTDIILLYKLTREIENYTVKDPLNPPLDKLRKIGEDKNIPGPKLVEILDIFKRYWDRNVKDNIRFSTDMTWEEFRRKIEYGSCGMSKNDISKMLEITSYIRDHRIKVGTAPPIQSLLKYMREVKKIPVGEINRLSDGFLKCWEKYIIKGNVKKRIRGIPWELISHSISDIALLTANLSELHKMDRAGRQRWLKIMEADNLKHMNIITRKREPITILDPESYNKINQKEREILESSGKLHIGFPLNVDTFDLGYKDSFVDPLAETDPIYTSNLEKAKIEEVYRDIFVSE